MSRIIKILSLAMVLCLLAAVPAMASNPYLGRQNWRFDSVTTAPGYLMEKAKGPNDNGQTGSVTIAAGGSAIWMADQAAQADVTFTGGSWAFTIVTDSDWGTLGSLCNVEVGKWDGVSFVPMVPKHKQTSFSVSAGRQIILAAAQTGAVTIENGKWLAVKIINNDNKNHVVHTGMGVKGSNVSSPQTDPGYPLPELATAILLGAGVLGLGGFILMRRRKAAMTA